MYFTIVARHFSPRDFILHLHPANRESHTCHWGFDVSRWRSYLHIQVRSNILNYNYSFLNIFYYYANKIIDICFLFIQHDVYIQKDIDGNNGEMLIDNKEPYHKYLLNRQRKHPINFAREKSKTQEEICASEENEIKSIGKYHVYTI